MDSKLYQLIWSPLLANYTHESMTAKQTTDNRHLNFWHWKKVRSTSEKEKKWYVSITYRGPRHERCNTTTLYYNSNNSAMFLARENTNSKTYLQLMSFIQMTKTTNIYNYMKTWSAWCYIIHYYITLSF